MVQHGASQFTAYFGYQSDNPQAVNIPVGSSNKLTPTPQDRGQPTVAQPESRPMAAATPRCAVAARIAAILATVLVLSPGTLAGYAEDA